MPSLIIQGVPTQILLIFSSKQKYLQLFSVSPFRKGKKLIQLGTKNWSNSQNNWNYLQCIFLPASFSVAPCWFTEKKKKWGGFFLTHEKIGKGEKTFSSHGPKKDLPTLWRELKFPIEGNFNSTRDWKFKWAFFIYLFYCKFQDRQQTNRQTDTVLWILCNGAGNASIFFV